MKGAFGTFCLVVAACAGPTRRPEPIHELLVDETIRDDLSHPTDVVDWKKLRVPADSELILALVVDAGERFAGDISLFLTDSGASLDTALAAGAQQLGPYRVVPGWIHVRIRARRGRAAYTLRATLRPTAPAVPAGG